MRILFLTITTPKYQGDYMELTILNGLRKLVGDKCVDLPRKKVCYHDFSEIPKSSLHGRGFSLLSYPIADIDNTLRENYRDIEFDAILIGHSHLYGEDIMCRLEGVKTKSVWILDGHDLFGQAPRMIRYKEKLVIGVQYKNPFKRELIEEVPSEFNVYPTGFGVPVEVIRPINIQGKTQLFQRTAPSFSLFGGDPELGTRAHHIFEHEQDYYDDLSCSWFGLTCIKGGWDSLRHYEIIAAGTLVLYRDYDLKPSECSPQLLPTLSYSTPEQLKDIVQSLVVNGKPTDRYLDLLKKQRRWLFEYGTTMARASAIYETMVNHVQR